MKLKIKQHGLVEAKTLVLTEEGVVFRQANALSAPKKKFNFSQIDYILLSLGNAFSFGVGDEVFSIQIDSTNKNHQELIDTMVRKVRETL